MDLPKAKVGEQDLQDKFGDAVLRVQGESGPRDVIIDRASAHEGAAAPPPPPPGVYTAEGDPYQYRVEKDGSVTIMEGPTGVGTKLSQGKAYMAIVGQIHSGQLQKSGSAEPMEGLSADRPGAESRLDDTLEGLTRDSLKRSLAEK